MLETTLFDSQDVICSALFLLQENLHKLLNIEGC